MQLSMNNMNEKAKSQAEKEFLNEIKIEYQKVSELKKQKGEKIIFGSIIAKSRDAICPVCNYKVQSIYALWKRKLQTSQLNFLRLCRK